MIIYGKQASIYALKECSDKIETVYVSKLSLLPKDLLKKYGAKIKTIENKWAQKLSRGGNHQGIIVEMQEPQEPSVDSLKKGDFLLILDGLTDVGNIGAIIRSAYALGVDGIFVTGLRQLNLSGVVRASSGAALSMTPVVHNNILDLMNELHQVGFSIYGADLDGSSLQDASFSNKRVLVLGSEDRGISKRAKEKLDSIYKIEMSREFDSLNVSAAAAIFLHRMSYAIK
jgi:23S rRNA (guanosine2251-2'-O)-methyltransferase